jgi:hypothetical protein
MENPDQIGSSPLSRIQNLERIINKFRIATSGDGTVLGTFGKLPKNQEQSPLEQRLANIQQSRGSFGLIGENVDVAGNFKDGFTLS